MRKFKDILSLIAEAKLEPGGEDVGKLFGPRGRYSPEKAKIKEKTFKARAKSGEINVSIDRPSGLETTLGTHPPENAQFIEPTANQRAIGKRIIDRFITPHHPGIPEPEPKAKSKAKPKAKPKAKSQKVVLFTNNLHHDLIGTNNKTILITMQEPYSNSKFIEHSRKLTDTHAANIDSNSTQYSRRKSAHRTVDAHFADLTERIMGLSPDGVLPNHKKFGGAGITQISTPKQELHGTRSIKIHFAPFKTHVTHTGELKKLTQHLYDQTGHEWYIHPGSGTYMVGTEQSPLILTTDIHHPDLGEPGDEDDNSGNRKRKPKPRMPSLV